MSTRRSKSKSKSKKKNKSNHPLIQTIPPPIDDLSKQVHDGELLNIKCNVPTLNEMVTMNQIVEAYLKKHKRIIYGGTAIEALLRLKGYKYREDKLIDYDFYSDQYNKDSIAIANELFKKNYKYVRRISAIHAQTYRIGAEFASDFIADVTYLPPKVYSILPTININNILYTDPQFIKIDMYNSITTPNFSVFRWEKSYKRLIALEKEYPISKSKLTKPKQLPDPIPGAVHTLIQDRILTFGTDTLVAGDYAYNQYVPDSPVPIAVYEMYTTRTDTLTSDFIKLLKKYKPTSKKYYPYLEIFPGSVSIFIDSQKTPIITLYDIGEICIGPKKINNINVITYHYQLRFLYSKYNVEGIFNKSKLDKSKYSYMIQSILDTAEKYNKKNSLTGIEASNPYQIFQIDCISENYDEARLGVFKRAFYGIGLTPLYKPSKKFIDADSVKDIYQKNMLGEEIKPEIKTRTQTRKVSLDYTIDDISDIVNIN